LTYKHQRKPRPNAAVPGPPKVKLAAKIARRLEDQILAEAWPVGHQIGRESQLASDLGVCRWTLREAVRILEASGFVVRRKGAKGGLFVASDAHQFVCQTIGNYLEFLQVSAAEFTDVHFALNRFAMAEATGSVSAVQRRTLRRQLELLPDLPPAQQLESVGDVHQSLLRSCRNPAIVLYVGALNQMLFNACIYSALDDTTWISSLGAVVERISDFAAAVLDRRLDAVDAAIEQYCRICSQLFGASLFLLRKPVTQRVTQRAYDFFPPARPLKKVDRVEREIREMILEAGWPIGLSLGSEEQLAERFQVGRSVLREALRSLEQLGVIEMGRGGNSGLRVVSPDPARITDTCRRHLRRERMRSEDADAVRALLQQSRPNTQHPNHISSLFLQVLAE
jgi:DNA-binding FadR family transcriptional regulator